MSKTEFELLKIMFGNEFDFEVKKFIDLMIDFKFEQVLSDEFIFKYFANFEADKLNTSFECRIIGICALQTFVKQNWLCSQVFVSEKFIQHCDRIFDSNQILFENDEIICSETAVKYPCLLNAALKCFKQKWNCSLADIMWYSRSLITNQMILAEPSSRLYEELKLAALRFDDFINDFDAHENFELKLCLMQCCAEFSQFFLWFKDIQNADKYLKKAISLSEVSVQLIGNLGKRTKFQSKPTSLLTVDVKRNNIRTFDVVKSDLSSKMPTNIELNDDTLLKNIEFLDLKADLPQICPEEEGVLLASVAFSLKGGPYGDELIKEEALAFLEYIIHNTSTWSLKYKALYLRSLLETETKKIERTMMQLNELVDSYKDASQDINKLNLFYCAFLEPIWIIEKNFADCLRSLGCIKSALDIYMKLNLWESIVQCYQQLDRKDKAEAIIREQLKIRKTPYLLCLLGDITQDLSFYEEAWNLSNKKNSRSQRSIGDYYFDRKEYEKCINHYELSLELNSMQLNTWQHLGFASLETNNYILSAKSYRRFLQFEYDCFEAWNNLAKAYVKMNDKPRAWKTLQEALKCNYEEWRVWENYLLVSIDVGAFDDVINAWHRLIDLKGKHQDDDVAEILVKVACNEISIKSDDFQIEKLGEKLQKLFGRLAANGLCNSKLWLLYAKLLLYRREDIDKIRDQMMPVAAKAIDCAILRRSAGRDKSPIPAITSACWKQTIEGAQKKMVFGPAGCFQIGCSREGTNLSPTFTNDL
ncbi:tetratricopeptide repeat protein 27-like protein [Dinothrombium tinctorium]|uniref:Tetratricopeptide repeat protein 27-like protein n=1 Tax=Dinothrombium tinctorium TaxID=1965070 RepID=A0A443R4Q5_9ACAR|nr:tetratricopeptide repeat protein 27-like protein [Dinothrombium tinctorium]